MSNLHEELEIQIKSMTREEKIFFSQFVTSSDISAIFSAMKQNIAEETKRRTQNKIANTFTKGYSTGALFNSISVEVQGEEVKVLSSKSYFGILNEGYAGFDMKKGLAGTTVKMRLPGGRVIFRKCGDINPNSKKISQSTSNWQHPGYTARHIDKAVQAEMEEFIPEFARQTILRLINIAKSRAGIDLNGLTPGSANSQDLDAINERF